jgi:hypothetical protein
VGYQFGGIMSNLIEYDDGKLWGRAGGELEYVSQRIEWREDGSRWYPVVVIRFTDHDHFGSSYLKDLPSVSGMVDNQFYEIEFRLRGE